MTMTVRPDETHSLDRARRGRLVRRVGAAALVAFVALGLAGALGYRQAEVSASGRGYDVSLRYPAVTRGGLPTHWLLRLARSDGAPLTGTVEIATTSRYFDLLDHNQVTPDPAATWQDDRELRWTFEANGEPELVVRLDVRTEPDARWRHRARTTVAVAGSEVATLSYTTVVLP